MRKARWIAGPATAGIVIVLVAVTMPAMAGSQVVVDLSDENHSRVYIPARRDSDELGAAVAACDVNGDGVEDLVVGDPHGQPEGSDRNNCGEVWVFLGKRRSWAGTLALPEDADVHLYGQRSTDDLGSGVACGDVNGDGYDDLVLCAPYASRSRSGMRVTGQAHIVFGNPDMPTEIDLLENPGVVVYGTFDGGRMCRHPAVGDVNGDGTADVVLDDRMVPDSSGAWYGGEVYVLFGRKDWPPEIDLLEGEADVTIRGRAKEYLGTSLAVADQDGDGYADIFAGAPYADGDQGAREDSGKVYVFYGRASWPPEIDLLAESADSEIDGPDAKDQAARNRGLLVTNLDGDFRNELVLGAPLADGPDETRYNAGEVRRLSIEGRLPPLVDLRDWTDSVVWGRDGSSYPTQIGDSTGNTLAAGRVRGQRLPDLVISAPDGDGPGNARQDCGEIHVLYGTAPFPDVVDLAVEDPDVIVYGPAQQAWISAMSLPDLNGDGLRELAISSSVGRDSSLSQVILVSPYDVDGDGVEQLADNCPLVANPGQEDADADGRGDACAEDWDGDGQPDGEDCAPADAGARTPPEIGDLVFAAGSKSRMTWGPVDGADVYDVLRGDAGSLSSGDYGECVNDLDADRSDTEFEDPSEPGVGSSYTYLVRGRDLGCAAGGPWGRRSDGTPRENVDPADCP